MKVSLFVPCIIDQFMPATAENTRRVLEKAGCEVLYNPQQTCCGRPAYQAGYWDEAKKVGEKFLQDLPEGIPVVTPSAECVDMVKNGYNDLFTNTLQHNRCRALQGEIHELSSFLTDVLGVDYFGAELETRAVYHDGCSAIRGCGIKESPRQLLRQVAGFELIEAPDSEVCCGAGGGLAITNASISSAMAASKVQHAQQCGAESIVSTDPACILQLRSYIEQQKLPIRVFHIADVLSHGWPNI